MARLVDVVGDWEENGDRCLAVAVPITVQIAGKERKGTLEVIGRVPVGELAGLSKAERKRALVQAVKAALAEHEAATTQVSSNEITGKVDVD